MRGRLPSPLLAAAGCAIAALWVAVAAFHVDALASLDRRVLDGVSSLAGPQLEAWAWFATEFFNPLPFAVATAIVLAAAYLRGRLRLATATAAIFLGANLTTQLIKPLTASPRQPAWMPEAIWPSGHATAAMSLALCVVLVAPARLRPLAAASGALGAAVVGVSLVLVRSHFPSDVLAGMLVAGAWAGLVVAVLQGRGVQARAAVSARARRRARAPSAPARPPGAR